MRLKRLYKRDDEGNVVDPTPIGVEVEGLGASQDQHFSPDLVETAIKQGWMVLDGDELLLVAKNGDVPYRVLRTPGYYCCHCKAALPTGGQAALAHIMAEHGEAKSPDPENPAGYERINYLDCVEKNKRPEVTNG